MNFNVATKTGAKTVPKATPKRTARQSQIGFLPSLKDLSLDAFKTDDSQPNPYENYIKTRLSKKSKDMIDKENEHNCLNYAPLPVVIEKGDGVYMTDVEGRKFIDCLAAYSALNQGHNNKFIINAMKKQADKLNVTSRAMHNNVLGSAVKMLTSLFGFDRCILLNTGVEAGEAAVKFARRWGYQVKGIQSNKARVLFANGNFWGRTIAACGSSDDHSRYVDFGPFEGLNFDLIDYNDAEALEAYFKANPDCAAFMLEPIQGENGVWIPDHGYLSKVRELCTKYNVLMICDEVQTGLGRAGQMVYVNSEMVKPDMLLLGKSLSGGVLPVSAVLADNHVMDCIKPGDHGSTYGGNPVACTVSEAAVKYILENKLVSNAVTRGGELGLYLRTLLSSNSLVKEIRGRGLMYALEFEEKASVSASQICLILYERGLVCKPTKGNIIRISPPLILKEEEVFKIATIIGETLNYIETLVPFKGKKQSPRFNCQLPNEDSQLHFLKRREALEQVRAKWTSSPVVEKV